MVNPDVPVRELTVGDVRRIFMGDRQYWTRHSHIQLILQAPGSWEREVVLKVIYKMTEAEFRQYWISKVFRAEIVIAPTMVGSNKLALELVARTPGSISFVDASQIPANVKVVKVIRPMPNGNSGLGLKGEK